MTIDASEVLFGINITGNILKNKIIGTSDKDEINGGGAAYTIYGGEGDDTSIGGKGNDFLYGKEGRDIFFYNKGDGDDTIFDYDSKLDKIIVSCKVTNAAPDGNGNLVFSTEGNGKIILDRYDNTAVTFTDITGKHIYNDGHLD